MSAEALDDWLDNFFLALALQLNLAEMRRLMLAAKTRAKT